MSDASEAPVTQDPMPTGTPQSGGGTGGADFRAHRTCAIVMAISMRHSGSPDREAK